MKCWNTPPTGSESSFTEQFEKKPFSPSLIMRLFVTGGTGFIGSHFLNAACAEGHEVVAVRRPGSVPRVPVPKAVSWIEKPLVAIEPCDCHGCDAVVHFAADGVAHGQDLWHECFRVNVTDSLALWLSAARGGVSRFVICGSCFEYGASGSRYEAIPTTAPLEPTGPYHASKAAATMAAIAMCHEKLTECIVLRPFHVFGEGEHKSRLWPSLRAAALSGADYPMTFGQQLRDFVPVAQVAATFLDVCTNRAVEPGRPEVHNVGTGRPTTVLAFAEHWWKEWKATGQLLPGLLPYRQGEVIRYVPALTLDQSPVTIALSDAPSS
jgi:nucleoside-diphosphate-sugar epimerase